MNAIERLNRVRNGSFKYKRLLLKVEELETLATRTVPVLSQTPEAHSGINLRDDTWARLLDYKEECKAALNDYLKDCQELEAEIESCIKSSRIKAAMLCRYVDIKSIRDTGRCIGYEERQVRRLLRTGEKIYCEEMMKREAEKGE